MIPKIHPSNFTWSLWRGGTLRDLGISSNRTVFIIQKKAALKKYAIGYCAGQSLLCRPKNNSFAVMFQKGNLQFWTHTTVEEFNKIFRTSFRFTGHTLKNYGCNAVSTAKKYE
jgi:hypothetical protein